METIKRTREEIESTIKELVSRNKNSNLPEGVFSTSLEIAKLIGKRHDHVLRDIDEFINDNPKYFTQKDRSKFGGVNVFSTKMNPDIKYGYIDPYNIEDRRKFEPVNENVYERDRMVKFSYADEKGQIHPLYYLSKAGFLALMSFYRGTVAYLLSKYYFALEEYIALDAKITDELLLNTSAYILWYSTTYKESLTYIHYLKSINKDNVLDNDIKENEELDVQRKAGFIKNRIIQNRPRLKVIFDVMGVPYMDDPERDYYINSKEIATLTGKEHKHILRDIRTILLKLKDENIETDPTNFYETFQPDSYGRPQVTYVLDKVGFTTLMSRYFKEVNIILADYFVYSERFLVPILEKFLLVDIDKLQDALRIALYRELRSPYGPDHPEMYSAEEYDELLVDYRNKWINK